MEKQTLLVVDDDPSICESLRLVGEGCGFAVTTTSTADEFCKKYTEVNPDIITIDLGLGESDGVELLRWLSKGKSQKKIILISAYDEKVIQSALLLGRSQQLNIIAALRKPIDIVHLKSILHFPYDKSMQITEKTLHDAIDQKNLLLFYQPKIDILTGKLLGVEALVRWGLQEHSIIPPESFITIAEESGLIGLLSSWVNYEAVRQCADFQKKGLDITISINVSAKLLNNLSLPDELYELVKEYGISPEKICIEITESAAMENPTHTLDVLTRFRIKGFSLSIDDFGTGYSSLVELQHMPFCELKIDKSFVLKLKKDTPEYIIVRSVINLGHDLGLKVVAEGVETSQVLALLKELGCDIAQGYYIGHPMSVDEFFIWLQMHVDSAMIFRFSSDMRPK